MKIRQQTAWFLVLILVVVLTPTVVLAQETESESSDLGPFATLVSTIWDQLGLGNQAEADAGTPPEDLGASISPDGATTEGTSSDLGANISPDGATTEGPSNNLGANISPDG